MRRRTSYARKFFFERLNARLCLSVVTVDHVVVSSELRDPVAVDAVDFDGDGDTDFLSGADGIVAWHENTDGTGLTTRLHIVTAEADDTTAVLATDVDHDGDFDVVAASRNSLLWHENVDGKGHFALGGVIDVDVALTRLLAVDIDGDGDQDVIGASTAYQRVDWYENLDGLGGFADARQISDHRADALSVADLDSDGDLDVLTGQDVWIENSIDDGEINWIVNPVASNWRDLSLAAAMDVDRDGDADLVAFRNERAPDQEIHGALVLLENHNGMGQFGPPRLFHQGGGIQSIVLADVDNDGDTDILTAMFAPWTSRASAPDGLLWFENQGGFDAIAAAQRLPGSDPEASAIVAADVNSDGGIDVVTTSTVDDSVNWYRNLNQNDRFAERHSILHGSFGGGILLLDVDGDSDLDMVSDESWFENLDGGGTFQELRQETPGWALGQPVDVDGDGDEDRLSLLRLPFQYGDLDYRVELVWFENTDGAVSFQRRDQLELTDELSIDHQPFTMDVDADGDQDIVWPNRQDVYWYENADAQGTFKERELLAQFTQSIDVLIPEDIDKDGDTDLMFVGFRSVHWRENQSGDFAKSHSVTPNVTSNPSAYLRDFDGDDDLDLIISSGTLGPPRWFSNDGHGEFGNETLIEGSSSTHILPADVDQDGDLDVVSYSNRRSNGDIYWHENVNGLGDFGVTRQIGTHVAPSGILVEDFDGDGDLDVTTESTRYDRAIYFENVNGKDFGPGLNLKDVGRRTSLAAGDIDNDGDPDLATVVGKDHLGEFTVRWYQDRVLGDLNGDRQFDAEDLAIAFSRGKYNDGIENNSTFDEGDWNQDGDFDEQDLVDAFIAGHYVADERPMSSALAAAIDATYADDGGKRRYGL